MKKTALKTEEHMSFKNLRFLCGRKIFATCGDTSCKIPLLRRGGENSENF